MEFMAKAKNCLLWGLGLQRGAVNTLTYHEMLPSDDSTT